MKHVLPEPGTKSWIKEMRKALNNPNFHIKINVAACERAAEPEFIQQENWLGYKYKTWIRTKKQATDLNAAKQFLLTEAKNK